MSRPLPFAPRTNFHTHTFRCKHATGSVDDMCLSAIAAGVETLGFSDHAPFPDDRLTGSRMNFSEAETYCREVREAQERYAGRLRVLLGFEADYFPSLGPAFYEDLFFGRLGCDYLISGAHFLENAPREADLWRSGPDLGPDLLRFHVDLERQAVESGLFSYVAHPDMFACRCGAMTPDIAALCNELLDAAAALDVPLEINAYGLRKPPKQLPDGTSRPMYPWRPFWELAAVHGGIRAVVGADAHRPEDVWSNMDETFAWAAACGFVPENAGR